MSEDEFVVLIIQFYLIWYQIFIDLLGIATLSRKKYILVLYEVIA